MNLIIKISILLMAIINIIGVKYYRFKKLNMILKNADSDKEIKDSDYEFYKEERDKGFINDVYMIIGYMIAFIIFSFFTINNIKELLILVYTNVLLVYSLNVYYFKNEIKNSQDFKIKNEEYKNNSLNDKNPKTNKLKLFDESNNELSVEVYLLTYKKDSLENFFLNQIYAGLILGYLIINLIYIFIK